MMPTVLGKIPAGKDGIFSARWGSRRTGHAHCAVGLRMSWTRALTMPRTALLPSLRPVPGPALALNLLIRLKPTGGWGPCLSDLPCPIWSSCWLIPGAYFPESCLGHPGKPVPTSPLCKCFGVLASSLQNIPGPPHCPVALHTNEHIGMGSVTTFISLHGS